MGRAARYSEGEVSAMVANYAELKELRDTDSRGMRPLIALADLDRAMARLSWNEWGAVLLHGLLGIPQEETARLLELSQQAVSKRFRHGLEDIHHYINGGSY